MDIFISACHTCSTLIFVTRPIKLFIVALSLPSPSSMLKIPNGDMRLGHEEDRN